MLRRIAIAAVLYAIGLGLANGARAEHVAIQGSLGGLSVHGFDGNVLPQFSIVLGQRVFGNSFGI